MNWHIGQRIVAVRSHPDGDFRKGQEFEILALKRSSCCGDVIMDIGFTFRTSYNINCFACKRTKDVVMAGQPFFYSQINFARLDDLSNHTADSLMEEMDRDVRVSNEELIHN